MQQKLLNVQNVTRAQNAAQTQLLAALIRQHAATLQHVLHAKRLTLAARPSNQKAIRKADSYAGRYCSQSNSIFFYAYALCYYFGGEKRHLFLEMYAAEEFRAMEHRLFKNYRAPAQEMGFGQQVTAFIEICGHIQSVEGAELMDEQSGGRNDFGKLPTYVASAVVERLSAK